MGRESGYKRGSIFSYRVREGDLEIVYSVVDEDSCMFAGLFGE